MARNVRLTDHGWSRIRKAARMLDGAAVKVGISASTAGTEVVERAIHNEYGTEHIPARPFMRHTADRHEAEIRKVARVAAAGLLSGRLTVRGVLDTVGVRYQTWMKQVVRTSKSWAAPNAPATLDQKKGDIPLIDTGDLEKFIQYEKILGPRR